MNRRDFTLLTAGLAAAFIFPSLHCGSPMPHPNQESILPGELSAVLNKKEIIEMGRFYITQNPDYSDIKHITHSLFTNENGETYEGADDGQSIREYLGNRIKSDFEKGNTVEINGWILSVTEARQCAYLSLMP